MRTVLVLAVLAIAGGTVAALSDREQRLAGTNSVRAIDVAARLAPKATVCQDRELVPAGTAAVAIPAPPGQPQRGRLAVSIVGGGLALGSATAEVRGGRLRVPVLSVRRTLADVRVCVRNHGATPVALGGSPTTGGQAARIGPRPAPGRLTIEYLREGKESWWSLAGTVAHRAGLARTSWSGDWTLWATGGLLGVAWALAFVALLRGGGGGERRGRRPAGGGERRGGRSPRLGLPAVAWLCAGAGCLNALAWGLITPPFQVPDEPQHASYVQYLAETGKLPRPEPGDVFSAEEAAATEGTLYEGVVGNARARPVWTSLQEGRLDAALDRPLSRRSEGGQSNVTNNPALYYGVQTIPYTLATSGSFLDRLFWMRVLSALLAGLTVLLAFAFVRELLPRVPWAWPVGALAAAFQPMFGFISGGVNNDDLLAPAAAAFLLLVTRALRSGLTPRRAAALGAVAAVGLLAKANMMGLLPAAGLGLAILVWRSPDRRAALKLSGIAIAAMAIPVVIYLAVNLTYWDRPLWSGVGEVGATAAGRPATLREQLSYLWQFYLPRLPFMDDHFHEYPLWETWFRGWIGRFGWLDYEFPRAVYWAALAVWAGMLALAGRELVRARSAVRRRLPELASLLAGVAGLLLLVAVAGYRGRLDTGFVFEQARYLLPLLPLYAAVVALAARGAGARLGPAVGAALVTATVAHGLFAQLLTLSRYYG